MLQLVNYSTDWSKATHRQPVLSPRPPKRADALCHSNGRHPRLFVVEEGTYSFPRSLGPIISDRPRVAPALRQMRPSICGDTIFGAAVIIKYSIQVKLLKTTVIGYIIKATCNLDVLISERTETNDGSRGTGGTERERGLIESTA